MINNIKDFKKEMLSCGHNNLYLVRALELCELLKPLEDSPMVVAIADVVLLRVYEYENKKELTITLCNTCDDSYMAQFTYHYCNRIVKGICKTIGEVALLAQIYKTF